MPVRAKKLTDEVYCLMDGAQIVGFAIKRLGGAWSMRDVANRALDEVDYGSPYVVAKYFSISWYLKNG